MVWKVLFISYSPSPNYPSYVMETYLGKIKGFRVYLVNSTGYHKNHFTKRLTKNEFENLKPEIEDIIDEIGMEVRDILERKRTNWQLISK